MFNVAASKVSFPWPRPLPRYPRQRALRPWAVSVWPGVARSKYNFERINRKNDSNCEDVLLVLAMNRPMFGANTASADFMVLAGIT